MTGVGAGRPMARVLVAQDDPELRYLFSVILAGEDRDVLLARSGQEVENLLQDGAVDLLVLDLLLPDTDGRSLLRRLRARPSTSTLPVIVVTTQLKPELRAECYEIGADSVVEKPFDPEMFASDVTLRLERAEALERGARQDDLTGYLNMAGFLDALREEPGDRHPVMVAEIDGIREIGDRFGWGTAEMVTFELGRALAKGLPDSAVLARLAGGEFAVLLPGADDQGGCALAESLVESVRKVPIRGPDGETFRLTASVGCRMVPSSSDPESMVEDVRDLTRRAQSAGGNRVCHPDAPAFHDESSPILVAEDDDITAKILVHRLEKEGFEVVRFDNGQDAYKGALEQVPCLAVLDVKMPGMDGFEVLQRLRKTPSYAQVPIMMLTSMGGEADVVRGFRLGADDYMLKPFSPTEFLARARRLLRRGRIPAAV